MNNPKLILGAAAIGIITGGILGFARSDFAQNAISEGAVLRGQRIIRVIRQLATTVQNTTTAPKKKASLQKEIDALLRKLDRAYGKLRGHHRALLANAIYSPNSGLRPIIGDQIDTRYPDPQLAD